MVAGTKKEPAGGDVDLRQAKMKKLLNGNWADGSMEVKISYQAGSSAGPGGDQKLHEVGCR